MDYLKKQERKQVHPRATANFLSKITFCYTFGLFKRIYGGKRFGENDLYEVLREHEAQKLGTELESHMEKDIKIHGRLSIYRILWSCYGKEYLLLGLVQMIIRTFVIVSIPWTLSQVILYFQPNQKILTRKDACFYAYLMIALSIANVIYLHNYLLYLTSMGIRVRTAFCSVIYRKCLRLPKTSLYQITAGKIVTLLTKDVGAFESIIFYANDVWIGCVQTAIVCYLVYRKMDVAALVGVGCFLLVIPFQVYIGKMASRLRMESGKNTDERLQVTQEALSAIKLIKIFTWEAIFRQKILTTRRKEVGTIAKIFMRKTIIILIGALTPKIAFYLLVMTYIWMGNTLSAELIYFIFSLFQRIKHALNVIIPKGITESAELSASVKRIESLLQAENSSVALDTLSKISENSSKICFKDVVVEYEGNIILNRVNFDVNEGLNVLTGPIGSGKTTILKIILRDQLPQKGTVSINGSVSYASQEPWIFASTLQQNILFGEPLEQNRYKEILRISALCQDIMTFPGGDQIMIGENGCNLSSGQKARINLARALYRNRDIYLLDDCLRSLDIRVQDHIFKEGLLGFLKDKVCLIVTQNPRYISQNFKTLTIQNGNICVNGENFGAREISFGDIPAFDSRIKHSEHISTTLEQIEEPREDEQLIKKKSQNDKPLQKTSLGKVEGAVYGKYISFGGGYFVIIFILVALASTQFSVSYLEKLISIWVDLENDLESHRLKNLTTSMEYAELNDTRSFVLSLYSVMTAAMAVLSIISAYTFFSFTRRVSNKLHDLMVTKVINASMSFFDFTLLGDILNKLSKDLAVIDEHLPYIVFEFLDRLFAFLGIVTLLIYVNLYFLLPILLIVVSMYFIRNIYMPAGITLQRLDVSTRSPIVGYLSATLTGLTTIRAFGVQPIMIQEFDRHQDLYTSASYTSRCWARAFGFILDTVCCIFTAGITARFVLLDKDTSAGDVGLAITQAAMMTSLVQYGIRQWAEMESKMTSVERVLQCEDIDQEKSNGGCIPEEWPKRGEISFENVTLRYPKADDDILKNLTFNIRPGEKVAVVGRTGAGKSTLILALLRLYDYTGIVKIDGVETKTLHLDTLRKKITVVPQDSLLFSGTIRDNIDPERKYTETQIWNAVEQAGLKRVVSCLDTNTNASNLSSGHKQLFCLARGIIENNKIIVFDEANADLDVETDLLVNKTLKESLCSCTVITIAHKLHSIMDYDRVMVIEKGEIIEFDCPSELMKNTEGTFSKMLQSNGTFI